MNRQGLQLARNSVVVRAGSLPRRTACVVAALDGYGTATTTTTGRQSLSNSAVSQRSAMSSTWRKRTCTSAVPSFQLRHSSSTPASSSSSSSSSSPTPPPPTRDNSHPNLFYHCLPIPDDNTLALSYLEDPPVLSTSGETIVSATVLGFLPMDPEAGLNDFVENRPFRTLLHTSIKAAVEAGHAKTVETEAMMRGSDGYLHIADERNLPPAGRIPEPEDILGSVYVEGGKPVPGTYEPQPMHRLVTPDGVAVLPDGIAQHVLKSLRKVLEEERKAAKATAAGAGP